MQAYFYALANHLQTSLQGDENFNCQFSAESSDFVRFNRGKIRQPGHVRQIYLSLQWIDGRRHASSTATLSGQLGDDLVLLSTLVRELRAQLPDLPDDPHLLLSEQARCSENISAARLPESAEIVNDILRAANRYDMVGILAVGPIYRGFANARGQRNWHENTSFNFDWSLYQVSDKAVKANHAGFEWNREAFDAKFASAAAQLNVLKREAITITPGAYRVFLAPAALEEVLSMLNWGGVSEKALRTKHSSLRRMRDEGLRLNPMVQLSENTAKGLAPGFQSEGFIKPPSVSLIAGGQLVGSLVSPRSAKEYGLLPNSDAREAMSSMDLGAGSLPMSRALDELGTGIFVSNLWYLNYSDRANCRLTGMTRFASFWVENGKVVAPLNVMRFDDSLFRMLGENLLALTVERDFLIDTQSYGERSTASARLPGALIDSVSFVL